MKGFKTLVVTLMTLSLVLVTVVFCSAKTNLTVLSSGEILYTTATNVAVPSGTSSIVSNAVKVTSVFPKTLTIPNSVTSIGSGAFTKYPNLKSVTIDNYPGAVSIASNAFPKGASVVYLREAPTTTTTTTKAATTTTTKAPATTKPSTTTTKKAVTTTKKAVANVISSNKTTTTTTTTTTVVDITESDVPLVTAQENDLDWWNDLVNNSSNPETPTTPASSGTSLGGELLSKGAVVIVAFTSVFLGYIKFKK